MPGEEQVPPLEQFDEIQRGESLGGVEEAPEDKQRLRKKRKKIRLL